MSTYHTLTSNVPDLKRRVNAIARKLAKYNLACTFNILSTEVQLIPHYTEVTTLDGRQIRQREDDIPAEVTTYEFSMPELKLSGWTLVAIISHHVSTQTNLSRVCHIQTNNSYYPLQSYYLHQTYF